MAAVAAISEEYEADPEVDADAPVGPADPSCCASVAICAYAALVTRREHREVREGEDPACVSIIVLVTPRRR